MTPAEKDKREAEIRKAARALLGAGSKRERARLITRASEISRRKSKRAHAT